MTIYLISNNENFRKALRFFLEKCTSHIVVGEAADISVVSENETLKADVILMDLLKPGENGVEAAKYMMKTNKDLKIVGIVDKYDVIDMEVLMVSGFRGIVNKFRLFEQLETAVNAAMDGGYYFPEKKPLKQRKSEKILKS